MYWLGTDELGRDLLSRIFHGGGSLLLAALIPLAVSYLIGVPIGLLVGYVGGKADAISDFIVNVLFAIPALVVVLGVSIATNNTCSSSPQSSASSSAAASSDWSGPPHRPLEICSTWMQPESPASPGPGSCSGTPA